MIHLRNFIKSKQVKSVYSIVNSETYKWNAIGKYWLTSLDETYGTDFFLCSYSDTQGIGQKFATKEDLIEENIVGIIKFKFRVMLYIIQMLPPME